MCWLLFNYVLCSGISPGYLPSQQEVSALNQNPVRHIIPSKTTMCQLQWRDFFFNAKPSA